MKNTRQTNILYFVAILIIILFSEILKSYAHFVNFEQTGGLDPMVFGYPKEFKNVSFDFAILLGAIVATASLLLNKRIGWYLTTGLLIFGIVFLTFVVGNQFLTYVSSVSAKYIFTVIWMMLFLAYLSKTKVIEQYKVQKNSRFVGVVIGIGILIALIICYS